MATTSTTHAEREEERVIKATKIALNKLVGPHEMLCGFYDLDPFLSPEIVFKTEEEANKYMPYDAPTPLINPDTGEITEVPWNDEKTQDEIFKSKYIKIQKKPSYLNQ